MAIKKKKISKKRYSEKAENAITLNMASTTDMRKIRKELKNNVGAEAVKRFNKELKQIIEDLDIHFDEGGWDIDYIMYLHDLTRAIVGTDLFLVLAYAMHNKRQDLEFKTCINQYTGRSFFGISKKKRNNGKKQTTRKTSKRASGSNTKSKRPGKSKKAS